MRGVNVAFVFLLGLFLVSTGCAKKASPLVTAPPPPATVEAPPPPPPPLPAEAPAPSPPSALTEEEIFARKTLDELNAERPLRDVHFDFDSAQLRESERDTLTANAQWMRRWTSTHVLVEGHCDARGTQEYNIALGERRAAATRDYLTSLGVSTERIRIVSKGEEAPVCTDEGEACWRQNRRGHFLITAK